MDADVQSWNQMEIGSMDAHRLTATEEISGYRQCWENDGSHVLGQRRHDTYSLHSQEYNNDGWDLRRCVTNEVSSSIAWKMTQKGCSCSFIMEAFLLIGRLMLTSFSSTTTLKLFLMLRTHLTSHQAILGCFQHWRTLFMVAYFQVVPLLQQRFSSGHNEPLKKRLLWPCNRDIGIVKNVYVYRVITLRSDSIFSFLGWVFFF